MFCKPFGARARQVIFNWNLILCLPSSQTVDSFQIKKKKLGKGSKRKKEEKKLQMLVLPLHVGTS